MYMVANCTESVTYWQAVIQRFVLCFTNTKNDRNERIEISVLLRDTCIQLRVRSLHSDWSELNWTATPVQFRYTKWTKQTNVQFSSFLSLCTRL